MALTSVIQEIVFIRGLLSEIGVHIEKPTNVYEDNQACIAFANDAQISKRAKHIDIKFHFTREKIEDGSVRLIYIPTDKNMADFLTKPLPRGPLTTARNAINLIEDEKGKCWSSPLQLH